VRLVRSGDRGVAAAAHDLGVSEPTLRQWCKDAQIEEMKGGQAATDQLQELVRLRRECRVLREERDILRKAALLLGRESVGRG
jgi:transposase